MRTTLAIARASLFVALALALVGSPAHVEADTSSSLGDRFGEGSTPFTGLAKAPEANLFTGSLGTSVPIQIPPGRKNVTPQLALQYTSPGAPGPFGYGWDLPIGRIERSTKWGVPRCNGPHIDDFVLVLPTGAVELVQESPGGNTFRGKIEESYLKAERFPAQNRWEVSDRAGLKYYFSANGSASSVLANTTPPEFMNQATCAFTTAWALNWVVDGNDNMVLFTWTKILNVLYPNIIYYGGNFGAFPFPYEVHFELEDRLSGDHIRSFRNGVNAQLTRRVKRIHVKSAVPTHEGTIRTYILGYTDNPDGYRSLLNSV